MKRLAIALGLGVVVMALVISFAMYISNDLRWIYSLGAAGLFLSALLLGSRSGKGVLPWLALCLPLSVLFTLLVLQARNRPLTLVDTSLNVLLWFAWGGLGLLWRARSRVPAFVGIALLVGFSAWYAAAFLPAAAVRAHDRFLSAPAPVFALQTLEGSDIPASTWKGKIVVLDFFSETCGPCLAELPHLEQARRDLQEREDVLLVVVASDVAGDTPDSIRACMKKNNIGLRTAFDRGGKAHDAFGFVGVPALVVLDKSGNVRLTREGYNRAEAGLFRTNLLKLLSSL